VKAREGRKKDHDVSVVRKIIKMRRRHRSRRGHRKNPGRGKGPSEIVKRKPNNDNKDLDTFNDSETAAYKNGDGIYNQYGILCKMNKDIAYKHITVGYLLDTGVSSLCSSFGATLAYGDKELMFMYYKPLDYISYKGRQISNGFVVNYLSSSLTEHLMTIPTLLIDDNVVTNEMLEKLAPVVGVTSGVTVTAFMNFINGKSGFEIMENTLNAGVNQALTTGVMTMTKDTVAMTALNTFSKSVSAKILIGTGIAFNPAAVTTIVTSFILCATQRVAMYGLEKIHAALYLPDEEAVRFWRSTNKSRVYDLNTTYVQRDPFLTKRFVSKGISVH
jgi:hypothetical protein